ncbi:MAG: hypothetical protein ACOC4A_01780, partial [Spirochaetota bacterium]
MDDVIHAVLDAILFGSEEREPLGGVDFDRLGETRVARRLSRLAGRLAGRGDGRGDGRGNGRAAGENDGVAAFLET